MIKFFLGYLLTFGGISQFIMTLVRHLDVTNGTKFYLSISFFAALLHLKEGELLAIYTIS